MILAVGIGSGTSYDQTPSDTHYSFGYNGNSTAYMNSDIGKCKFLGNVSKVGNRFRSNSISNGYLGPHKQKIYVDNTMVQQSLTRTPGIVRSVNVLKT